MARMPEDQHPPLWKQLLGAATGATVALLLYGGFVVASPHLSVFTAYLSSTLEGKIDHLPASQRSPRTIREEALVQKEVLEDRARAATTKMQEGKSASVISVPLLAAKQEEGEAPKKKTTASHRPKKQNQSHAEQKTQKKSDVKRKEEKLPSTGVPFWAIGGVAFGLAMSMRYRKELIHIKKWPQ